MKRVKLTNKREDITKTINELIALGFKKGSILKIFGNKNFYAAEDRYYLNLYSDDDIMLFLEHKFALKAIIADGVETNTWIRNLFKMGLIKEYIYKKVLKISYYQVTIKLYENDFTPKELRALNEYKEKLKKVLE